MPRRATTNTLGGLNPSDPNDPTRAFWKFTEPDLPPVEGYPSPYTTAPPVTYWGNRSVDYGNSIPMGGGGPQASIPRSTQRTAAAGGDPSGSGLVNRNLFRQDNAANTDFWESRQTSTNRPHQAMDFQDLGASASAEVTLPTYTATDPSAFSPLPTNYPYGEPSVEVPRTDGGRSAGDLDAGPSLFPDGGANPFDDWWKQSVDTVTGTSSDGGSVWQGNEQIGDFGGDTTLGTDLNADLGSLGYGEGYPPVESPAEMPWQDDTGLNQPPPPGPIQDEWTTSPGDRRFLPEGAETQTANSGGDINAFGSFGSPLTLGAYLSTPLATMRYGEGYPAVGSGNVIVGGRDTGPQGGMSQEEIQFYRERGETPPLTASADETIPTAPAVSPEVRRGELVSPPPTSVGPMSPAAYDRATFGGLRPTGYRDTRGSAVFDPRAANALLMSTQAYGGAANRMTSGDAGRTVFDPSQGAGHVNDEGFIERTAGGVLANDPWSNWTYADQAADQARVKAAKARGARGLANTGG